MSILRILLGGPTRKRSVRKKRRKPTAHARMARATRKSGWF